ncbi:hypothetical protein [Phosphitispora sp. TUW77]|uniref:hypothetical protein n=1 Tax=Phosphitispora sp. TUW77 TaxID=3152361 RepID=UPI003AB49ECE
MTKIEKRFQKILNNPKDVKWAELQAVLNKFGLICEPPGSGSHWSVYDEKSGTIATVPVHNNRVKAIYVKKLIALIKEIREEE